MQVEAAGQWSVGLLDAYIAMIPKAEGPWSASFMRFAGCLSALGLGSSGAS